ncbi:MAG: hypothetical protein PHN74_00915 [Candidatus Pacebacteria bacterium]|nr:hypothetical protein [Candidatus Paceibacterota bacterium]
MEQKFEHSALDKDVERLAAEVQTYRAERGLDKVDEMTIKSVIKSKLYHHPTVVNIQNDGKVASQIQDASAQTLPDYLQSESPEIKLKVEELVETTLHHGISQGIEKARKAGPFILDAYHDALTAKLYQELKDRGHLK